MLAGVLGPLYLIVGLSGLLHSKGWKTLIDKWQKDHLVIFPLMFMYVVGGLIIVNMNNVWEWNLWLVVTLTGWVMLVKGAFYFLAPPSVIASAFEMKKNTALMYLGTVIAIVIGAALTYQVYFV